MKYLIALWIITISLTVYYFLPKSVEASNKDGLYFKITRPHGWGNDIKITSINILYEKEDVAKHPFEIKVEKDITPTPKSVKEEK